MFKNKIKNTYTDSLNGDIQYSFIARNQINKNATIKTPIVNCLSVISFIVSLTLFSTAATATANGNVGDGDSSAISSFWTSVAKSAGGDVGGVVAGYALSALGISGASQEDADLTAIINLLTEIDAELTVLVNEVQQLQCLTSQDQTTLTDSIKHIQGLYDTYSGWVNGAPTVPCWEESDVSGNICFGQTGIKTWLNEVIDPENGVDADLDAINDVMIQAGNTGVISTCVKTITTNYNSSDDPKKFVFDWTGDTDNPGYYDQVQSLTNYYYGVQAQGAALLSEASHLQACLSLGSSDCQFTGQGTDNSDESVYLNATPNNPGDICANAEAGSVAAEDCTDAQNSVVKIYGYIKAQLLEAGAPYTTALVGKVMAQASLSKADLIYPKSLEDFTNNATASGKKIQKSPCAVPLTSADPCGFTVGGYNHTAPSGTTYGEVTDASGKVAFEGYDVWAFGNVSHEGDNLTTLLANYNGKTAGDTGGALGNWMASVGFINNSDSSKGPLGNPGLKIVLTGEVHNAAGNNEAVCFMDTNISRSGSG
ncbi:MAG: hypothetical protein DRR42_24790, partial [Gammaproteobacteria bacterium]